MLLVVVYRMLHCLCSVGLTKQQVYMMLLCCRYAQLFFPHLKSSGLCDASIHNATLQLGFKIIRVPKGTTHKYVLFAMPHFVCCNVTCDFMYEG